jgi:inositol-pentakisphosphate 2-kinase
VNEGGATIVFSYAGPSHPTFSGKVLRLRKTLRGHPGNGKPDEPDDPSIAFQNKVISRLISPANLPELVALRLSPSWLASLAQVAEEARPISRRAKDHLDTSRSKGVLATNLIENPGLSVEIKV